MSSELQLKCTTASENEQPFSYLTSDDMTSCFCSMAVAERIHWEQTQLLPFFRSTLLVDTFATLRVRLAFLEAKSEYLQRRCRAKLWGDCLFHEGASTETGHVEATRHIARELTEATVQRWMDISIPRWIEEDAHLELRAFCEELTGEGGGAVLRAIVEESMAECSRS